MRDAFVTIHGHFYQPPRENAWLEVIEREESAHPFHDWNERITFECYRSNAYGRIVDGKGRILDLNNNYASISFNFGPTLLSWLEEKSPLVYQKVIEADRESFRRFGQGSAIAQIYNHIIMPLANERDKETEVLWGIADFEKRFRRRPEALWLPETAVNYATLRVLVKYGMKYLILSPFQALRVRPFGGRKWSDASQGRIETTQPYRCFVKDEGGRRRADQFIDVFFYDGAISREVSFGDLLKDGNVFCDRFLKACQSSKKRPQLIHIATDGETYGHHKKFGDMTLAYALNEGFRSRGLEITNYSAFLKRFPPVYEVEIDEGPKGEGTSWSCTHGVGRWKEDCGCSTGGREGWNQKWRKPLRETLDALRDELAALFEIEGEKIFHDVWEARNGYIDVILDRSLEGVTRFFDRFGLKRLDQRERIRGLRLLEMQRHALLMYTSCGWFFADLAGLETLQILQYAARAIQLAEELGARGVEERFVKGLARAVSNRSDIGDGEKIYHRLVKPRAVTAERIVNHFAIASFVSGQETRRIFSYQVEPLKSQRIEREGRTGAVGQVKVNSDIIPEPKSFLFSVIPSTRDLFQTWVLESDGEIHFDAFVEKVGEILMKDEEERHRVLTALFGDRVLAFRDTVREGREVLFQKLIEKDLKEYLWMYKELYERSKPTAEILFREGFEIPYEIRVAAEVTLSRRLLDEVNELRRDVRGVLEAAKIDQIVEEAKRLGLSLRKEAAASVLKGILEERMAHLRASKEEADLTAQEEEIEALVLLLGQAERWGLEIPKEEAQDVMGDLLREYVLGLEESWWDQAKGKPFSPKLLLLAEKLNFNVERFSKFLRWEGKAS